jgi:BlaI family transcriptional regulator, penicillinase repressor
LKKMPKISEAEWTVMKVLWSAESPKTANQVVDILKNKTSWNPRTIRTMIGRLVKKKALGFTQDQKDKRKYFYYTLVSEEETARAETKSMLKRIYGGALNVMVANFLEEESLSKDEIDELREILDRKQKEIDE